MFDLSIIILNLFEKKNDIKNSNPLKKCPKIIKPLIELLFSREPRVLLTQNKFNQSDWSYFQNNRTINFLSVEQKSPKLISRVAQLSQLLKKRP